jgi:ribonuclease HI
MSGDRVKSAEAEMQKLLDTRIIREVQYPIWVANVVMVPKKNGNMRMCIDFTELNKACPKDPYPLPRIDVIIDQVAGCDMLSLLDCFSGYHQVWMRREDEAKTGFTTPFDIFCFVRMPEGLRNAGSSFNRMMKLILGNQLGRNASTYVDDIVIMSEREKDHIADLTETFDKMRRNGLKLNPEKCIFGIRKGQLLGCMVSKWGIQENPQKIEALQRMQPPSSRKEVQRLTGIIALLNRFISKDAERSLPFFKVLRANSTFEWGPEQQQAFDDLKKYLEDAAVMNKPSPKAELLLYIAATDTVVSAVLVEERKEADALMQFPIYYVSEALNGSKLFYSEMEKMAYAVVMAKRKIRHYFQCHNVSVPTAFPLRDMFENKESTGRMGKWATELAEHVINFVARSAIKSQVLADFVADWTPSAPKGEAIVTEPVWEVRCDGAYCHLGSAAAAVLKSPSGIKLRYALRLNCDNCTNNMAEYEGLLLALRKARAVGARRLVILTDSELVVGHIGKTYKAKKPDMMKYLQAVGSMEKFFIGITVRSFPRNYNKEADAIAKATALLEPLPPDVFYETTAVRSAADEAAPPKFVNAI